MPREARKKSETGIYHIMLRGINQQVIFEDDEDYEKFIATLERYKSVSEYKIFAYCLMPNHIHVLLKVEKEDLDLIMKRIAGSYVYWYNWKYYRKGHLFQDRFKSEVVEDDAYFLTVLRYIHQNPVKAGMAKTIDEYKFSSYNEYMSTNKLIDNELALSMLGKEEFVIFNNEINNDICLEIEDTDGRVREKEARQIIEEVSNCKNATEFQKLERNIRNKYICKLKEEGLSIRQISRLTGISFAIVRKL